MSASRVDLSGEFHELLDAVLADLDEGFEADIAAEAVAASIGAHTRRRGDEVEVFDRRKWATECAHVHRRYRPGDHLSILAIIWR